MHSLVMSTHSYNFPMTSFNNNNGSRYTIVDLCSTSFLYSNIMSVCVVAIVYPTYHILALCKLLHVCHHQMDELTPTDKLSPLALAIMSQIGSTATTGWNCFQLRVSSS